MSHYHHQQQQQHPMTGPSFILPQIVPKHQHQHEQQFMVAEPPFSYFPPKSDLVAPLPSISELLASANVGPSKLPGPSSMSARSSPAASPPRSIDFPPPREQQLFPAYQDVSRHPGDGEYLLPQIPPGYEAPRMPSPSNYDMIRSVSPASFDPQRCLSPRNSTSLGTDSIDGLSGGYSSPQKPAIRDMSREGDLATAMILMGIQAKSDPAFPFRKKRQRSSPAQLNVLEEHFLLNPMPSHISRVELALRLNMTPRRIQVWFQNKRAKVRRAIRNGEEVNVSLPESDSDE